MSKRKASPASSSREDHRIWKDVLGHLASIEKNPPTCTATDLVREFNISHPSASKVLRRLQNWGHVRHVGFEQAGGEGVGGRPLKVYEVTEKGRASADRHARAGKGR